MRKLKDEVYALVRVTVAKTWGDRIKELRKAHNWSQAELARRAGRLSTMTISSIERGANTTTDTLEAIADALGVTMASFFTLTPQAEEELVERILQRIIASNIPNQVAGVVKTELKAMLKETVNNAPSAAKSAKRRS